MPAGWYSAKVAALPGEHWSYKSQDASVRHIGPMAPGLQGRVRVGNWRPASPPLMPTAWALAAIQGLNRKVEKRTGSKEPGARSWTKNAALEKELAS